MTMKERGQTLTIDEFRQRFTAAVAAAVALAEQALEEHLPAEYIYDLNAYGLAGHETDLDGIFARLYVDGRMPVVVDIAVWGIVEGRTLIWVRPSGHPFEREVDTTFYQPPDLTPFKPVVLEQHDSRRGAWPITRRYLEERGANWRRTSHTHSLG